MHKGKRWVDENKDEAKKMGNKSEHPDAYESLTAFGVGSEVKQAAKKTDEAIGVIKKK